MKILFTIAAALFAPLAFFASAGDGKFTKEKLAEFVGKKSPRDWRAG